MPKIQAGTSSDLVLSHSRIKNSPLLCHLVSCCTKILSVPHGDTKGFLMCASMNTGAQFLHAGARARHRAGVGCGGGAIREREKSRRRRKSGYHHQVHYSAVCGFLLQLGLSQKPHVPHQDY